jgi:hypothetical protein
MPGRGDEEDEGVKAVAPPPWEHFVFFKFVCICFGRKLQIKNY